MMTNQVFIIYAKEDLDKARHLYDKLAEAGFKPWLDVLNILPGEDWNQKIKIAINQSDFILICLSKNSIAKSGYVNKEIKLALYAADERPESDIFLIPIKLEPCKIPDYLSYIQAVNLFEENGFDYLFRSLNVGINIRAGKEEEVFSFYQVKNIQQLFKEGFNAEELRNFSSENTSFRKIYHQLLNIDNHHKVVEYLIRFAEQNFLFENILKWAEEKKPNVYNKFKPYYSKSYKEESVILKQDTIGLLKNPYVAGNPIQPENWKVFIGRTDIAKAIISEINRDAQKPSLLLYGRRRMGKTSAIYNISNLISDPNILQVYISAQSSKFHSDSNFCFYLVKEIEKTLRNNSIDTEILINNGYLNRETFRNEPIVFLSDFFEDCDELLSQQKYNCLIAIDEYEEIDSHLTNSNELSNQSYLTRELLLELRNTLQHRPRFMFLFAGTHYMSDLSNVNWTEIFINLKTLHISFLERENGYKLLTEPQPRLLYESRDLIDLLLYITGCQPYLLQAIASELINVLNYKSQYIVTADILNEAISEVIKKCNIFFDYLWDTECSSLDHKKIVKMVANSVDGIYDKDLDEFNDILRDLIRKEVLKAEDDIIKLTMPFLKFWMEKNKYIL